VVLGAHIGDLDSPLSVAVFRRAIDDLLGFFQSRPDVVACDLHPDYASTRHAERLAARWGVPLLRVQHHHAHVAAVMAEHGLAGPVLGFAWDGTGYGPDGTVWGGEALVCQGGDYRRAAHFRTFRLPGGDCAVREPRRAALGLLVELLGDEALRHASRWFNAAELDTLTTMLARNVNSPRTSSLGRLFDAVAAICGLPALVSFEGQAAMALEFAADESVSDNYPLDLRLSGDCTIIDWGAMLRELLADRAAGVGAARIAARFHNWLAEAAAAVALKVAEQMQLRPAELPIALGGGCFQNALLDRLLHERLSAAGFMVYTQQLTPPGDGGIALGQIFVAIHSPLSRLRERGRG
jgi:hydrogenase maturation protein HypF